LLALGRRKEGMSKERQRDTKTEVYERGYNVKEEQLRGILDHDTVKTG